ncbi:MAG: hypothetical protein DMG12_01635 [Acidobacteria bacterium]|nr:MAG: hypothetical protein DMG12_01635 [Acidobacteriota bacterium]
MRTILIMGERRAATSTTSTSSSVTTPRPGSPTDVRPPRSARSKMPQPSSPEQWDPFDRRLSCGIGETGA